MVLSMSRKVILGINHDVIITSTDGHNGAVSRPMPKARRYADDRAPTLDEIQMMTIKYPSYSMI